MKISSEVGAATSAVSGLKGIGKVSKGSQVSISYSNISAMKKGAEVTNELSDNVNELLSCVKEQADKVIQLAQNISSRDSQDSSSFK